MISVPTALILGAGASQPYGYPSGARLIREIVSRLSQERGVSPSRFSELTDLGYHADEIRTFIRDLNNSGVRSIDEFLEHRKDFMDVGKTAIAQAIIGCEHENSDRDPLFVVDSRSELQTPRWYPQLRAALNSPLEELGQNQLVIVTFNYDRSLEHYLHTALISKYGARAETKIVDWLKAIRFVHVHGKLGHLPWQSATGQRQYGFTKSPDEMKTSGSLISIVHEGEQRGDQFARARGYLKDCQRVVFLGFGYHADNLMRLGIGKLDPNLQTILGTRVGITDLELRNLVAKTNELRDLVPLPTLHIHDFLRQAVILDGAVTIKQ